jgi:phosphoribosylamine--glycine ligase
MRKSPELSQLYCLPGNGGINELAIALDADVNDHMAVIELCKNNQIDLIVIGPEAPLTAGLSDALSAAGFRVFGPSRAASQLEGSKGYTKDLCRDYNIPTAKYQRFQSAQPAKDYIRSQGSPIVVKADGLAAGKGVVIAWSIEEAEKAIDLCFDGTFGTAGQEVVIEEYLSGEEASFFALVDGDFALPLVTAQDHKRVFDGDNGPNTGGMGAYSPAPVMTAALCNRTMKEIINPTVKAMKDRGIPYKGVLYAGLMITEKGPQLIEYNVRFGDPECQVLMMRLKSDLLTALNATVDGCLEETELQWHDMCALTVVMATRGYPGSYNNGSVIKGLDDAGQLPSIQIFHAGTSRMNGNVIATGGRVLNITASGQSIAEARDNAYRAVEKIDWPEGMYRTDIGWRAIERENSENSLLDK